MDPLFAATGGTLADYAQIISTCGAVAVAYLFLRAWSNERRMQNEAEAARLLQQAETERTRHVALEQIGKDCHEHNAAREDLLRATIERQAKALDRNTEALGRISQLLHDYPPPPPRPPHNGNAPH